MATKRFGIRLAALLVASASCLLAAPAAAQEGPITSAEGLLHELERVGDDIRTLKADLQYDRRLLLQGDRHIRRGTLLFSQPGEGQPGRRMFEVDFTVLYTMARKEDDRQVWTFDGQWLYERRPAERQFVARQIAPEGSNVDPLRLGEGPVPIPIGQRAADVLSRYDAQLRPHVDGVEEEPTLVQFVESCWQLRLTPRAELADEDEFEEIRLWYLNDSLLPRMAMTTNRAGDVSVVQLLNVQINTALPEGAFRVERPAPEEGWDVQVEAYEERPGAACGER
jgi:hypothetical protein